jgi:hypothetical protein
MFHKAKGAAFVNPANVKQTTTSEMNNLFIDLLTKIYDDHRDLFAIEIQTTGNLSDKYDVYRSFRRGSKSRALSKEVSPAEQYQVNRWRKKGKWQAPKCCNQLTSYTLMSRWSRKLFYGTQGRCNLG